MQFLMHSHAIGIILVETFLPLFLISVFFYASVAPSIWLWLFVLAGMISRVIAPIWPFTLYALNFEQAPLKMIGVVASVLVAILSVAMILVSTVGLATLSALLH
jgi:hypothetical protein